MIKGVISPRAFVPRISVFLAGVLLGSQSIVVTWASGQVWESAAFCCVCSSVRSVKLGGKRAVPLCCGQAVR
jgi:hypothetical protein